jgi:hypothetical protein
MKAFMVLLLSFMLAFPVCTQGVSGIGNLPKEGESPLEISVKLKITIGNKVFTAIMYDNATTAAFIAKLPLALNMNEMNGNEKYYDLPEDFRADPPSPAGTIRAGDLVCWSSNCLVLFYKTFSSGYRYVRLGYIEDASGLESALGRGNVHVTFAVDDNH